MPSDPLAFVHVALVPDIARSMEYINRSTGEEELEGRAQCAIFYSITSALPGSDASPISVLRPSLIHVAAPSPLPLPPSPLARPTWSGAWKRAHQEGRQLVVQRRAAA
eukprot:scaffold149_cov315-Pinguiococcus_pyrenoidosus.AAC.34